MKYRGFLTCVLSKIKENMKSILKKDCKQDEKKQRFY